jgi:hypothetical protein
MPEGPILIKNSAISILKMDFTSQIRESPEMGSLKQQKLIVNACWLYWLHQCSQLCLESIFHVLKCQNKYPFIVSFYNLLSEVKKSKFARTFYMPGDNFLFFAVNTVSCFS